MCKFVSSRISFLRLLVYQYVDVVQVPKEVVWMLTSFVYAKVLQVLVDYVYLVTEDTIGTVSYRDMFFVFIRSSNFIFCIA